MTPRTRANSAFLSAIALLCICCFATYLSFSYFRESELWVSHSQEVRAAVGDLEASINSAARARMSFLMSGSDSDLATYRAATALIPERIQHLHQLTKDNPVQTEHCVQLESLTSERLKTWEEAVRQKDAGKIVDLNALVQQNITLSRQSGAVAEAIRAEEVRLLLFRNMAAQRHFLIASVGVVSSFTLALLLLYLHYWLLTGELRAREEAEKVIRSAYERETALRQEQERFRLFVDAVKDYAVYVLDPLGNVASWNQGAERIKGYTASEILGEHFSRFFTLLDIQAGKPEQEMRTAIQEGQFQGEGWRVRKDGSQFWANIVLTAIKDSQGKLAGFTKITRDFTERMQAQQALRQTNAELAAEVSIRQAAERKLANSEKSLRELSLHLLKTQDEERRRIGRELHDSLGQYLAMLKMNLDSIQSVLGTNHDGVGQEVARCVRIAEDSIKEVRTISYLLYPPMLEEVGLRSAIQWYLEGFSQRSSIKTNFDADPEFGRFSREIELALFRVLQESLTNVHRHSGSATAEIKLAKNNGQVILQVRDHGKGISPQLLEESDRDWLGSLGVGLRGMNERIKQLGGNFDISSGENGTAVTATIPVSEPVTASVTAN
jgi:PAS domain S-box-containing protein